MWAILFIFGTFFVSVFTFQLIVSYILQRTCRLGLSFILSWYLTKLLANYYKIWCVCPNMDIWFLIHNSAIYLNSGLNCIYEFRRPLATSRAPKMLFLVMFRRFSIIEPKLDQIWVWLHRGHRCADGIYEPLKSLVTGSTLLDNCCVTRKS